MNDNLEASSAVELLTAARRENRQAKKEERGLVQGARVPDIRGM